MQFTAINSLRYYTEEYRPPFLTIHDFNVTIVNIIVLALAACDSGFSA